jgi:pyruvate kinase
MDCVRLNFSHGTYDQFAHIIQTARALSKEVGRELAILQDLQGPKIRVGEVPEAGIMLTNGATVVLSIKKRKTSRHRRNKLEGRRR